MASAQGHPPAAALPAARRREARWLIFVFLLALAVRLAYLAQIRDLPTVQTLVMDAARYDALARRILDEGWRPRTAFYQAPLYPYLLAAVYAVTGRSMQAVRLLQCLLGAATAVLTALAAGRLASPPRRGRLALLATAGVLAALYAPAVHYTPLLLKTVPALFLESAALVLLLPAGRRFTPPRGLAVGLLLGTAALLQENLLLLVPAVLCYLLAVPPLAAPPPPPRRPWSAAAAVALGAALALAPAALLNLAASGSLLLTSSQSGINFYIGNARGATGIYVALSGGGETPARQKADSEYLAALFASRDSGHPVAPSSLAPAQVSHILWRETLRQVAADPPRWLRLLAKKLRLFWNAYEVPDAEGFRVYRRESLVLSLDPVGFGLVAPLAALGLLALARGAPGDPGDPGDRRAAGLLTLLVATLCASVVLFFVFGRYRLGVVPFLLPPAAAGLIELREVARRAGRGLRRPAIDLAVLAAAGLAVNLPCYTATEMRSHDAAIECNLGAAALMQAEASYNDFRRLAGTPGGGPPGAVPGAAAQERYTAALRLADRSVGYLAAAVADGPNFTGARIAWANALGDRGRYLLDAGRVDPALADLEAARREAVTAAAGATDPELRTLAQTLAAHLDEQLTAVRTWQAAPARPPRTGPSG